MGRRARNRSDGLDGSAEEVSVARGRGRGGRGARPRRERLGREAPGAVFRGPPIAVTCECGEKHDAAYGEVWTCERCGRRWDTNQIPREDYEVIRRTQLRYRALPVLFGVLVASLALFFILTGNTFSVFFLLPVALSVWFVFLRPVHRRRYRRAIADLPRWELKPE
jgi:hypothetical protein